MARWLMGRLLGVLLTVVGAVTLIFWLVQLIPGDPAEAALAQSNVSEAVIERRRQALALDRPLLVQYGLMMGRLVRGDLGVSWVSGQQVQVMVGPQLPPTLRLAAASLIIALGLGTMLGTVASVRRFPVLASAAQQVGNLLLGLPILLSGTILIWVFAVRLGWLPGSGQGSFSRIILPAAAVGLSSTGAIARSVEEGMQRVGDSLFVLAGRARGVGRFRVLLLYRLRVGLLPVLDIAALQAGFLIGGTVVAEQLFARQGLGRLIVTAVLNKDLPVVQAGVILAALTYALLSLVADLSAGLLDPRIRLEAS